MMLDDLLRNPLPCSQCGRTLEPIDPAEGIPPRLTDTDAPLCEACQDRAIDAAFEPRCTFCNGRLEDTGSHLAIDTGPARELFPHGLNACLGCMRSVAEWVKPARPAEGSR